MSIRDGIANYYPLGGMRAIGALIQARLLGTTPAFAANAPGITHPVRLRVRTTDAIIFCQVLKVREYELPFSVAPNVIVDAGANVGFTSVFYANKYPNAKIFSIEPAASNFRMLLRNAAPYRNIVPIHAALWCASGNIAITGPEFGHCGFRVSDTPETSSERVPAVTVGSVMNRYGIEFIDILKLDIEGAEKEVLEGSTEWIDKVGVISVETHDRFKPGCTQALERATGHFPFRYSNGEVESFARNPPA
ncbi:MAG: FkbM family methyltransferase [Candidatus Acidiferrales bacterium]|jgi:FkbM family methyltransferase